jgi:hypothetical protein
MMTFTVAVKVGAHTRAELVESEEIDADVLVRCTELAHEMLAHLERVARQQAERRKTKARDA